MVRPATSPGDGRSESGAQEQGADGAPRPCWTQPYWSCGRYSLLHGRGTCVDLSLFWVNSAHYFSGSRVPHPWSSTCSPLPPPQLPAPHRLLPQGPQLEADRRGEGPGVLHLLLLLLLCPHWTSLLTREPCCWRDSHLGAGSCYWDQLDFFLFRLKQRSWVAKESAA